MSVDRKVTLLSEHGIRPSRIERTKKALILRNGKVCTIDWSGNVEQVGSDDVGAILLDESPGNLIPGDSATASFGNDPLNDDRVYVTAPHDSAWEGKFIEIVFNSGPDLDPAFSVTGPDDIVLYLGTDENGDVDPLKNTPELVAEAINAVDGWSATFEGDTAIGFDPEHPVFAELTGYTADTPATTGTQGQVAYVVTDGVIVEKWLCVQDNTWQRQPLDTVLTEDEVAAGAIPIYRSLAVTQSAYDGLVAANALDANTNYFIVEEET